MVITDPFIQIQSQYREPLLSSHITQLNHIIHQLDLSILLPAMRDLCIQQCTESHISKTSSIASVLGFMETGDVYLR